MTGSLLFVELSDHVSIDLLLCVVTFFSLTILWETLCGRDGDGEWPAGG